MAERLNILHEAVRSNDCTPNIIWNIVREQPDLLNSIDGNGQSPLLVALQSEKPLEVIHKMLELGAEVNFRNYLDESPLHYAIKAYRESDSLLDIVKLLIKFGADVNLKAMSHRTPLHNLLHYVKGNVRIKVMDILLKSGINTNHISGNFVSYLQTISFQVRKLNVNLEMSKMILEFGAKPLVNIYHHLSTVNFMKEINHYSIQLVKLLMQYILIHEIKTDVFKGKRRVLSKKYDKIINLASFSGKKCYAELVKYRGSLIKELTMMLQDKISKNMTLFAFISNRCSSGLKYDENEESVLHNVISIYHSNRYVCCDDLFQASFKQGALVSILCNVCIFAKKPIPKSVSSVKVILTSDAILHIASYLCRRDILNLILAYWIPACEDERLPVKRCLRKRPSSVDNSQNNISNSLTKHLKFK